jgi:hypothetical protein
MLTTCRDCALVVEISGLNNHLVEECEMRRNYRNVIFFERLKISAQDAKWRLPMRILSSIPRR